MSKIFFIKPDSPLPVDLKVPPLGMLYIASALRKRNKGHEVTLLDMKEKKVSVQSVVDKILEFKTDVVGIGCMTSEYPTVEKLVREIKSRDQKIITVIGGPHIVLSPTGPLSNADIDYVIAGEGEETFPELVEALEAGKDPSGVQGIGFNLNGEVILTATRPYIEDLDQLSFPAWDLIDLEDYYKVPLSHKMLTVDSRFMTIFTSRGCPYQCAYCFKVFGKKARLRSAQNVFEEMQTLNRRYGISNFIIIDDVFNINPQRVESLCDLIISSSLQPKLAFLGGFRGDIVTERLIKRLKEVGTYNISYAIETSSMRLQKVIKKNAKVARLKEVIAYTNKLGIFTTGFFMMGLPTETLGEVKDNIHYALSSKLNLVIFSILTPFPGTQMYDDLKRDGYKIDSKHENISFYKPTVTTNELGAKRIHLMLTFAYFRLLLNPRRIINTFLILPKRRKIFSFLYFYFKRLRISVAGIIN
ncbi:MAG: cobalamin-dependent protein [Bacteriovoracaceae bacterium]|nr:cobalamin-dependent protein [Bacteriovoracaceae bacterium]